MNFEDRLVFCKVKGKNTLPRFTSDTVYVSVLFMSENVIRKSSWSVFHLVVHIMQVKVRVKYRLKLIAVIHMMTSQGRICVLCVANGLDGNHTWPVTVGYILKKTGMRAVNVRNVFHLRVDSVVICTCIAVNTSAQNVGNVVEVNRIWQHTCEAIQERNRLDVAFVANDSHSHLTLLSTAEFTVKRHRTNVTCVTRRLVRMELWRITWASTRERSRTNVACVTRHLIGLEV